MNKPLTIEEARVAVATFGQHSKAELDFARTVALAALEDYGELDHRQWEDVRKSGIWNDHVSVQSALAAVRLLTNRAAPADFFDREPDLEAPTPEPSLRSIIFGYYRPHFDALKALDLTNAYIDALRAQQL